MIYLDNAATTIKKPDAVYDAVLDAMKHCGNSGRGMSAEMMRPDSFLRQMPLRH